MALFASIQPTAVSEAKEFVGIANPSIEIQSPIINANLAATKDSNIEEFQNNQALYQPQLEATARAIKIMDGEAKLKTPDLDTASEPKVVPTETNEQVDPLKPSNLSDSEVSKEEENGAEPTLEDDQQDEDKTPEELLEMGYKVAQQKTDERR